MIDNNFYFFKDNELKSLILETFNTNKNDVIKVSYKNEIVWLKRPRESNSNLLHKLVYFTTRIRGLMPVEAKNKTQAIYHEVSKLKRFKEKDILVPEVLGCTPDLFVLEDTGVTIKHFLKNEEVSTSTIEKTLENCVLTLSNIHNKSEYHAGPQIKNYTIKNDIISAIDFEDSFSKDFDLKDIQFRDFFLFLVSLAELNKEINYKEIINIYKTTTKNQTIDKDLKRIALNLNFLMKIVENEFLNKKFSKDVIYNYNLFKALQNL